jgi:hypothetical protein
VRLRLDSKLFESARLKASELHPNACPHLKLLDERLADPNFRDARFEYAAGLPEVQHR